MFLTALLVLVVGLASNHARLVVNPTSNLRLLDHNMGGRMFNGVGDAMALDRDQGLLYVVGGASEMLNVVDVTDKINLRVPYQKHFSATGDGIPLDVAVCRFSGLNQIARLAISFADRDATYEGHIEIFDLLTYGDWNLKQIQKITVKPDPKSIVFNTECDKLIVACEAKAGGRGDPAQFEDPAGHIDVVQIDPTATTFTLNFQAPSTIRQVFSDYTDSQMGIANDLEPEAVVMGSNNTAYFILQENNAIGGFKISNVVDPIPIHDLGIKDFNMFDIDTSDQDLSQSPNGDGINLQPRNIQAFYQPGDLESFVFNGEDYVITADQGAKKEYTAGVHGVDFTEAIRGRTIPVEELEIGSIGDQTVTDLSQNSRMGRLYISNLKQTSDGFDSSIFGKFTSLRMYGARGFSIWRPSDLTQTYNSGGDFEKYMAQNYSSVFNGNCQNGNRSPPQDKDTRSDDQGPEPSAVATALFNGKRIAVIGSGRTGALFVYSIGPDANNHPVGSYESIFKPGDINEIWNTLYTNNQAGHPIITDMDLYENADGSADLYVLGGATGTVTIYSVNEVL